MINQKTKTVKTKAKIAVPYAALGRQAKAVKKELMAAAEAVLDGGHYILGPSVSAFEKQFAEYCQTKFSVGLSNGTSALYLVLKSLGIGEGDEVITAPNSFIASASSIALTGARPVFVDIREDMNINPELLEKAITRKTRAIMPVHLTGRPARMPEILSIAKKHRLFVLEDAAQSVGAKLNGKKVGSFGDAACFSLHPLKNLHAFGDAGALTTNDASMQEWMNKARNHGLKNRDECEFWSFNCRLDEIQAALLNVQLKHLDEWTEERRRLAFRYNELLKPFVEVPEEGKGETHVYQTYMIKAESRDELRTYLNENGVQASVHYPVPIPLQPAAKGLGYGPKDFPVTMRTVARILSLPLYTGMTREEQDTVVELIAEFYKGAKWKK